jgi:predicted SAM-dependent methyltransferase
MRELLLSLATRVAPLELLRQTRWELTLRGRAAIAAWSPRQRELLRNIREARRTDLKINLGCGPLPAEGWLNVDGDSIHADLVQILGRPLELPDGCAAVVFCEHVLEHVEYPGAARAILRDVQRVLRPGGVFRVIVPDAERAIRAYAAGDTTLLHQLAPSEPTPIEVVNKIFRENGFHRFAWDYALLAKELEAAGFSRVRRAAFRDSAVPEANIDLDDADRIAQSLYAEAIK